MYELPSHSYYILHNNAYGICDSDMNLKVSYPGDLS